MIEQGLDQAAQVALIAHLRRRGSGARPLFVLTRSSAILDLAAVGPTRRSSSAPPITARRPASRHIPARRATRPSPPVWPRPRCGRARWVSSRGGPRWRDGVGMSGTGGFRSSMSTTGTGK
jgi:hypothetical protein